MVQALTQPYRTPHRGWKGAFVAVFAAFAVGWLGGGSCQVSYCSEDCDPCVRQCHCTNSVCIQTNATFQATHALTEFVPVEYATDSGATRRTLIEIVGLSVQRAGGPAWPEADDVKRFARGILAVNATLLARPEIDSAFEFDSISAFETAWVVQFHQERTETSRSLTNTVSLLLDRSGNLVEIDQTVAR